MQAVHILGLHWAKEVDPASLGGATAKAARGRRQGSRTGPLSEPEGIFLPRSSSRKVEWGAAGSQRKERVEGGRKKQINLEWTQGRKGSGIETLVKAQHVKKKAIQLHYMDPSYPTLSLAMLLQ